MASVARQANFTLPEDLLDELKRTVPKGEQSKVVGQALRNELKRIKFKKALEKSFGAWKAGKHSELAQGSRRFIRSLRKSTRLKRVATR
jgi:metal-responsive CopG/Arc/MetJ family transcriptional regulator